MASAWGKSWGALWGNSWGLLDTQPTPETITGGGGIAFWRGLDYYERRKKRAREALGPEPIKAVESAVLRTVQRRTERDRAKDLQTAEALLASDLARLNLDLSTAILALLRLEYDLWLAEQEEAAIAMLLFEM